jgi:uroporphyrinogen III methyltransferase / synthase
MAGPISALPFGGPPAAPGTVHLVGGGPGDPGLARPARRTPAVTATFVAYDRLSPPEALRLCADGAELVDVGKLPDRHKLTQDEINALLVEKALAGQAVVRFKGGDPFVLGRGSEEALACRAPASRSRSCPRSPRASPPPPTPASPSPTAGCAGLRGRDRPRGPDEGRHAGRLRRPRAVPRHAAPVHGGRPLRSIAAALVAGGRAPRRPSRSSAGARRRGSDAHRTLADIADRVEAGSFANPAIIVVGDVVALRDELAWYDRRPLHGRSVLVPRTRHQASALSERLRALGAEPVEAPTIAIEPGREPDRLRSTLAAARDGAYDWMALTSVNGVDAVFAALDDLGLDARALARVSVAVVGSGTAEALADRGVRADLVPERFTTSGLAAAFRGVAPGRILLPRADIATPALTAALDETGWTTDEVEAYRTVPARGLPEGVRERILAGDVDVLAFASSSTVRNFLDLLDGEVPAATQVVSIGPVTSATCRDLGLRVDAEGDPHDLDGLVAAIVAAAGR